MAWEELAQATLPVGDVLTLRRNGDEFEIRFNLTELMSSRNAVSERALARIACGRIAGPAPHVLIGGLGMGFTVRAVLDAIGADGRVTVAELVPEVVAWNRGALGDLAGRPLEDSRVTVQVGDVADVLRDNPSAFDAILMDVDNGPGAVLFEGNRRLYSADGVRAILAALKPGGTFALWAADRSAEFERVLETGGIACERIDVRVRDDGIAHTIYLSGCPRR